MNAETPFAVERTLRQHLDRERNSPLGWTVRQLLRADRTRLEFWLGSAVVENVEVERRYVEGEVEALCIATAERAPDLRACIGYTVSEGCRPEATAWLIDRDDGTIIDVARSRRDALGFFGVELRPVEVAHWVPSDPAQVAVTDISRTRLLV